MGSVAAALTLAAFANTIDGPFHFDDSHSIKDNAWIRSFEHVPRYFTDITTFSPLVENRSYRPILLITYAISHAIAGGATWGYHLITLLLHALGALLVGLLLERLLSAEGYSQRIADRAALFGTALFAVHPLLSEPVNYISARSSMQAAVLMFGALLLYIRGRETGRQRLMWGSAALLLLAMGTKIIAMTAPVLMLAWEVLFGPDARSFKWRRWLRAIAVPVAVVVGFTVLHEALMGAAGRSARSNITPLSYLLTETQVWLRFIGLFVWPEDLSADVVMRWAEAPWEGPVARAIVANALLIGLAAASARRRPTVAFGVLWYYVTLSPTNSIVPLSEPASEHRVYIAAPGLVWAAVAFAARYARRRVWPRWQAIAAGAAATALIAGFAVRSHYRNRTWSTDEALWFSVVRAYPDNGRAHLNYGLALMNRGDLAGARVSLDRCAQTWPGYVFCYINLAVLALRQGRQADAEKQIAWAESIRPDNIYVAQWRGEVELAAERWASAETAFRRALTSSPGHRASERGLALSLFEQGKLTEAAPLLNRLEQGGALNARGWYAQGYFAQSANDQARAVSCYTAALRGDPSLRRARYNLAVLHHRAGRTAVAIVEYAYLARAPDTDADILYNLASAYWTVGRLDEARTVRARLQRRFPRYPGLAKLTF